MPFVVSLLEDPRQQNCFGQLLETPNSSTVSQSFGVFHGIQLSANDPVSFVVQAYGARPPFHFLRLHPAFARACGIRTADQLLLEAVSDTRPCVSMEVEPLTSDDWNVLESTAAVVEEVFLDQIRAIRGGMQFVLFLAPGVLARFSVVRTVPETDGTQVLMASNATEVLVVPKPDTRSPSRTGVPSPSVSLADKLASSSLHDVLLDGLLYTAPDTKLRILPSELYGDLDLSHLKLSNGAFIVALNADRCTTVRKSLVKVRSAGRHGHASLFAFLLEVPVDSRDHFLQHIVSVLKRFSRHCVVSRDFGPPEFPACSWLRVHPLTRADVALAPTLTVSLPPHSDLTAAEVRQKLTRQCRGNGHFAPVVFSATGFPLLTEDVPLTLRVSEVDSTDPRCFYFWPDAMPIVNVENEERKKSSENVANAKSGGKSSQSSSNKQIPFQFHSTPCQKMAFKHQDEFLTTMLTELATLTAAGEITVRLVVGNSGSGKSTWLTLLADRAFWEQCVCVLLLDCFDWRGKSTETVEKALSKVIQELQSRAPSLLLLDNVDFLNAAVEDEDRRRFIHKTYSKISSLLATSGVSVIATARSQNQLPEALLNTNGRRLFDTVHELSSLSQEACVQVVGSVLATSEVQLDLEVRAQLEKLSLAALVRVGERARLLLSEEASPEAAVMAALQAMPVGGSRLANTAANETPILFDDVGGLEEVKQRLLEVFLWPSKYGSLFARCGLRVGGGAVLHGPSGCGKSLVARAVAAESRLAVFSVKGPELLSKYIGASEQNVRDLFEKARAAKPALIFFDEFDALAPKRGHDSTGVTDRVVNQLLTELDGVDSANDGVYVLAATNRLDLIDGALLRPGRFDHKITVGLPSCSARADILTVLCRDVRLADDVDLRQVAVRTEGWSGADLRGLVLNAHFVAADESKLCEEEPTVTMQHLSEAVAASGNKRRNKMTPVQAEVASRVTLA